MVIFKNLWSPSQELSENCREFYIGNDTENDTVVYTVVYAENDTLVYTAV